MAQVEIVVNAVRITFIPWFSWKIKENSEDVGHNRRTKDVKKKEKICILAKMIRPYVQNIRRIKLFTSINTDVTLYDTK